MSVVLDSVPTVPTVRPMLMTPSRLLEFQYTQEGCITYWNYLHPIGEPIKYHDNWIVKRFETEILAYSKTGKVYKCALRVMDDGPYGTNGEYRYKVRLYRRKKNGGQMEWLIRVQ